MVPGVDGKDAKQGNARKDRVPSLFQIFAASHLLKYSNPSNHFPVSLCRTTTNTGRALMIKE